MKKASRGEKLTVEFRVAPELNKRVTLLLYKWILMSHVYMYYQAFRKELAPKDLITQDDTAMFLSSKDPEKAVRR